MKQIKTTQWWTIQQAAEHLQMSVEKVYKLCQKNKMPCYKVGGQWRFDQDEIDAWVRSKSKYKYCV